MTEENKPLPKLVAIVGPTACGKTACGIRLAKKFDGEIISADSRQIYKKMDIGTAKELGEWKWSGLKRIYYIEHIPHHLIDFLDPGKIFSAAEFHDQAGKHAKTISGNNKLPIVVGGTGLYISAIIEGYDVPRVAPDKKLREKLYKEVEKYGVQYLHEKLKKLDPEAAKRIHPNNVRYVVRAIEINLKAGRNKTDKKAKKPLFDTLMIGIDWPREAIYERINIRVDNQIKRGLINEVKKLLKKGYKETLPAMSSLGIKEIIPYIKGEKPLEECVEILKKNTRNYSKRQMTWFRRYKKILWLDGKDL